MFDPFRDFEIIANEFFAARRQLRVPMAAWKNDDVVLIEFELPGVDEENIVLEVEHNKLSLKAVRPNREDLGEELVNERTFGAITHTLRLPPNLDLDAIEAHLDSGVLSLKIPVSEKAQSRTINISGKEDKATSD